MFFQYKHDQNTTYLGVLYFNLLNLATFHLSNSIDPKHVGLPVRTQDTQLNLNVR